MSSTHPPRIHFTVFGEAKPAGSKRAFVNPRTGRAIITDESGKKGKAWRSDIQEVAREAYHGPLLDQPLSVTVTFYRARPKGHYRTGKNAHMLRDSAPHYPTTRPDLLKLMRAVEDSLTGVIWRDDSLIVNEHLRARYTGDGRPHVDIEVMPL